MIGAAALLQAAGAPPRHVRHAEVVDLLASMNPDLPLELQALPNDDEEQWAQWIGFRDTDIRARLAQGDQDALVTWLLVGSSFTTQPRLDPAALVAAAGNPQIVQGQATVLKTRIDDFLRALSTPGTDERRLFARKFFEGNGFVVTGAAADQLKEHLVDAVQLFVLDRQVFSDRLTNLGRVSAAEAEVVMASLFQEKGLSLEAPLAPNYSIERSLAALKALNLIKAGSVSRVAIVGPGLSFSESDTGFDTYAPEMLQPFTVLDSVRKLQLGPASGAVDIQLFDISPRVAEHVTRLRDRAMRGQGFALNLPLSKDRAWTPAFRDYWMNAGNQIANGAPSPATAAPRGDDELRVINVAPAAVQQVSVVDLNIVTDRLDDAGFDLIVLTNVMPYYGRVEQALALSNLESMLKDGGFLLSNTALPAVRTTLRPLRALNVPYTDDNQGDRIIWYQKPVAAR